jgi:transposase
MADAEAISEAAQRPTMRFVRPKTAEAQASATVFRTRDLLVRQRTQMINALRGHLAEFGMVVRKGAEHAPKLVELVRDPTSELPEEARTVLEVLAQMLQQVEEKITVLDVEISRRARANPLIKRLMTIPGVGPITATALAALAPAPETFRRGRDFAAWIGLTPLQKSSGGKERLGKVSKMGERTLRRLLIIGASSATKAAARKGVGPESWLGRMLARKPHLVVAVALANKIARVAWALMAHGGTYRAPAVTA